MRIDGRPFNQIRDLKITPHFTRYAEGSALIEWGQTRVLCTASVETQLPKWLYGQNRGWVTAEYGMLPRSTHTRMRRDSIPNSGRTHEISRLIGRSLRSVVDLQALGERVIHLDCDVIQADGGTRTAAITGAFVALTLCIQKLHLQIPFSKLPLIDYVSAVSIGIGPKGPLLDLNYEEDSSVATDMNFVMTGSGKFVEVQGTAEKTPFSRDELVSLTELAEVGCRDLFQKQSEIIGKFFPLSNEVK